MSEAPTETQPRPPSPPRRRGLDPRKILRWLGPLLMVAVAVQAYLLFVRFGTANVDGALAIVEKNPAEVSRGDLVRIAGTPGGSPILRVVAVPGDTVAVADGRLTVGGSLAAASAEGLEALIGVVPGGSFLLLRADPAAAGDDSRSLGFVHRARIVQRVLTKLGGAPGDGR